MAYLKNRRSSMIGVIVFLLSLNLLFNDFALGADKSTPSGYNGLHGYIGFSTNGAPPGYDMGMGFYAAVWPLVSTPLANFQIGLPSAWIIPNNQDNSSTPLCPVGTYARDHWPERGPTWGSVFQTVEGGLGYWAGNRFRYDEPKFSMNGTPQCYDYEIGSPGWSFFRSSAPLDDDRLGIAQLSNRLLIPPDGITFDGEQNGAILGYSWMALPFTAATSGSMPTGDQSWACFLNASNFKRLIAYYVPETWSKIADIFSYPFDFGRGLDARPGIMGGGAMEINTVPFFKSTDLTGTIYTKIPQLQFPVDSQGRSFLVRDVTYYSKLALYDAVEAWREGGPTISGELADAGKWRTPLSTYSINYDQEDIPLIGIENTMNTQIYDYYTWGLEWSDTPGLFPQYFKQVGSNRGAISAAEVPDETGLKSMTFPEANSGSPYEASMTGAWVQPGPASAEYYAYLADGTKVIACKKDSPSTPTEDTERTPDFGGTESEGLTTVLFAALGHGAGGEIAGLNIGWAMSALGLSDGSPDYTEQLAKIEEDLQVIIGQLTQIQEELGEIEEELTVINCSEWASTLSTEKGRIDYLMSMYKEFVATALNGGTVSQDMLADWVDQVLAQGNYSSHTPMDEILSEIADQLFAPPSSGVIPACVQTITPPESSTFGTDIIYYNQVKQYIDYFYSYQVQGLTLLNEALHHKAWVAAGSPVSNSLSADSVSYVCQDVNAMIYCDESAGDVNNMYNNLLVQFTSGGAPYTDENIVLEYQTGLPYIWPRSLEDFTIAAGDDCDYPLTSEYPCGITAGLYNNENMKSVTYKGHTGWLIASNDGHLEHLLAGWTSGTVGDYLENSLGFKYMKNKIVMGNHTVSIELDLADTHQDYISFFDTDIDKSFGINQPTVSTNDYNKLAPSSDTKYYTTNGPCGDFYYLYSEGDGLPSLRNDFYNLNGKVYWASWSYLIAEHVCKSLTWDSEPGWLASNTATIQYRWPVGPLFNYTCTEGRNNKNAGGFWTMCGDDFTAWFNLYAPRPETCDNEGAGITCNLSDSTL